jgi:hypothetical protein
VKPGLPVSDCVKPSTSSNAAAMNPPWTQPGGPSYAEPKVTQPSALRSPVARMAMGGASGLASPINGLWSKKAPVSPALAVSAKPS